MSPDVNLNEGVAEMAPLRKEPRCCQTYQDQRWKPCPTTTQRLSLRFLLIVWFSSSLYITLKSNKTYTKCKWRNIICKRNSQRFQWIPWRKRSLLSGTLMKEIGPQSKEFAVLVLEELWNLLDVNDVTTWRISLWRHNMTDSQASQHDRSLWFLFSFQSQFSHLVASDLRKRTSYYCETIQTLPISWRETPTFCETVSLCWMKRKLSSWMATGFANATESPKTVTFWNFFFIKKEA